MEQVRDVMTQNPTSCDPAATVVDALEEDLTRRAGLPELGEPSLLHYSEGVRRVRLGPPRLVPR